MREQLFDCVAQVMARTLRMSRLCRLISRVRACLGTLMGHRVMLRYDPALRPPGMSGDPGIPGDSAPPEHDDHWSDNDLAIGTLLAQADAAISPITISAVKAAW
jgi:hypothetical protein